MGKGMLIKKITGEAFNTIHGIIIVTEQQIESLNIGDIIEFENKQYRFIGVPMLAGVADITKLSLIVEEIEANEEEKQNLDG